jgi:hypothetical protein
VCHGETCAGRRAPPGRGPERQDPGSSGLRVLPGDVGRRGPGCSQRRGPERSAGRTAAVTPTDAGTDALVRTDALAETGPDTGADTGPDTGGPSGCRPGPPPGPLGATLRPRSAHASPPLPTRRADAGTSPCLLRARPLAPPRLQVARRDTPRADTRSCVSVSVARRRRDRTGSHRFVQRQSAAEPAERRFRAAQRARGRKCEVVCPSALGDEHMRRDLRIQLGGLAAAADQHTGR